MGPDDIARVLKIESLLQGVCFQTYLHLTEYSKLDDAKYVAAITETGGMEANGRRRAGARLEAAKKLIGQAVRDGQFKAFELAAFARVVVEQENILNHQSLVGPLDLAVFQEDDDDDFPFDEDLSEGRNFELWFERLPLDQKTNLSRQLRKSHVRCLKMSRDGHRDIEVAAAPSNSLQ